MTDQETERTEIPRTVLKPLAVAALALLALTLTAGGAQADVMEDLAVQGEVDKDGDGRLSSFEVWVTADTMIREGYRKKTSKMNIPADHPPWINEGHPKFAYFAVVNQGGTKQEALIGIKQANTHVDETLLSQEITLREANDDRDVWLEGREIRDIEVVYVESDSSADALVFKEVDTLKAVGQGASGAAKAAGGVILCATGSVPAGLSSFASATGSFLKVGKSIKKSWDSDDHLDTDTITLKEPIRLERPSQDRKATVKVTANVDGAAVYLDGDRVGTTPWTGEMPVDVADVDGETTIRVEHDGYAAATKRVALSPPTTVDLGLKKTKKPLVVTSSPDGASVKVDGTTVGAAPLSTKVWTERSVDVTVEKSGYETWTRKGITAPATLSADLTSTDDDTDGNDSYVYVPNDPTLTDPTFTYTFTDVLPDISLPALDHANFTASPRTVRTGENVSLDASPSFILSGTNTTYRWDFGDGATGTGLNATHSYSDDGTYEVTLTLAGPNGTLDTAAVNVTVQNRAPIPDISLPGTPVTGRSVTLTAGGTSDPDGTVAEYRWDLDGDGSTDATTQTPRTSHTYRDPGTYAPSVTVVDDDGATATDSLPAIGVEEANEAPTSRSTPPPPRTRTDPSRSTAGTSGTAPPPPAQRSRTPSTAAAPTT